MPCPRCSADVASAGDNADLRCPSCGLQLSSAAQAELKYLSDLEQWIVTKRSWVLEHGADDAVVAADEVRPEIDEPRPARPGITAAGFILGTGVFALVAAAIAFTAFAWDVLGAVGQLLVLVVAGVGALAGGYRLAPRIPGTASALSVMGVLLLVVTSSFWISSDALSPWPRALSVVAAALLGLLWSYRQAQRQPAAAVLTAAVFAHMGLMALASAPILAAESAPGWVGWWVGGVCLAAAGAFTALAISDQRLAWHRVPWQWFAVVAGFIGTCVVAATVGGKLNDAGPTARLVIVTVAVAGAMAYLVTDRVLRARWWSYPTGAVALLVVSSVGTFAAAHDPENRFLLIPAAALLAVALVSAAIHVMARAQWSQAELGKESLVRFTSGTLIRLGAVAAAGALVLPFLASTAQPVVNGEIFSDLPRPAVTAWIRNDYPWWTGLGVALTAVAVCVVLHLVLVRLRPGKPTSLPAFTGFAVILLWSQQLLNDVNRYPADITVAEPAAVTALVVAGFGLLAVLASMRSAVWTLWFAGALAAEGGHLAWKWLNIDQWGLGPELHGLFIAVPLLLVGMLVVLLKHDHVVSTWSSVAPAITAALLFPVAWVLEDSLTRSAGAGAAPSTQALIRIVSFLILGLVLAILGGRNHWAGVFWPGVVAVIVIAIAQITDVAALLPQWVSLAVVGVGLLVAGARWESVRLRGRRTRQWAGTLH